MVMETNDFGLILLDFTIIGGDVIHNNIQWLLQIPLSKQTDQSISDLIQINKSFILFFLTAHRLKLIGKN